MAQAPLPEKQKDGKGKTIINAHIFGKYRYLDDTDAEDGITHVKVDPSNFGNIPGTIDHWKNDIERRRKNILALEEKTFINTITYIFQKKKQNMLMDEATGEELYQLHPSKAAKEALRKLEMKPTDMMSRLELVSIVGKSGRDFPVEVVRTLYLQATVAATFGELSNVGLNLILWAQEMYFSKLINKCREEVSLLEKKLGPRDGKNIYASHSTVLYKRLDGIKANWGTMLHYIQPSLPDPPSREISLTVKELTDFLVDKKRSDKDKEKEHLIIKATKVLLLIRNLPLLHDEGMKYIKVLKRIDAHEPLLYLLQAKINMSKFLFVVGRYREGSRNSELVAQIKDQFKNTYHQYGLAVRKIGNAPAVPADFTILIEYANLVHYFYRIAVNLIGIKLPTEWLETAFKKAKDALLLAQTEQSGKSEPLIKEILRDMNHAGLIS
ncbi:MAG: hypothetical protein HQM13_20905 [SAR324 cluster bacterium]|nr:hypothetical protein [SAR324 cluster bacterium]